MDYRVTSFSESKKGTKAQITVVVGKGRGSLSFTRHLERRNGYDWIGLNIDPRAIPLNEKYEEEMQAAGLILTVLESDLKRLENRLEDISKAPEGDIITEFMLLAAHVDLEEQLEIARDNITTATMAVDDAETKLNIVRRELPLMMSFNPYKYKR
ncbi:MAG: hypothetical protein A3J46_03285 [Candidatus Yanofskybacteria bacterium RIFCSPHIGHO2_02_FULL_41_11]|uniref:Uncharacterized protein n=1 Tax=Candidatus Yanofskybacteria bacterium RIFCSPHIGHO2_02_FULL_41_11 TaxID=1802675 RepID=A0A1F8F530_9BACT|nr:MAG: hypothetical protein A3J46_03285 [Candidatus Yanofskybacteria bacterium RIFCSPHIGHO2_02_FULL_41_11]